MVPGKGKRPFLNEGQMIDAAMRVGQKYGFVLFRNSVGFYRLGGRAVRYGLCRGSSDLIGWYKSPEGKALFVAIEVKFTKKTSSMQKNFVDKVKNSGGIGEILTKDRDFEQFFQELTQRYGA